MTVSQFSTAGGTASAGSEYSATFSADKAFDGNTATYWSTSASFGAPVDLQMDFGSGVQHKVSKYILLKQADPQYAPSAWTLQGSNDGSAWTDLDSQTGQTFVAATPKTYDSFSSSGNIAMYRYYRLHITTAGTSDYSQMSEFELWGDDGGAWSNIAKVNGVSSSDIAKVNGIAVADIAKFNGVAV